VSTLNVNRIVDSSGGVLSPISSVHKNRIINGQMVIDQRNAGASVGLIDGLYFVDRWKASISQTSKLTGQRSTVAPVGFVNSLSATVSTAFTPGAGDYAGLVQNIEGFNCADLGWGTANASPVTVSFQVRSSVTGTYSVAIHNGAVNRSYVATYVINAANTFETKTVTIPGDTTGTWTTDNSVSLTLYFALGMGSTYGGATAGVWNASLKLATTGQTQWVSTSGATFYITGVQLERGTQATSFEYRQYTTELQLCQRYLPAFSAAAGTGILGTGQTVATTAAFGTVAFPVATRVPPTGITISAAGDFGATQTGGGGVAYTSITFNTATTLCGEVNAAGASGLGAAGGSTQFRARTTSALLLFTGCEL
jgi:hypothetical protein